MNLTGKTIVLTGACGILGSVFTQTMASAGARVIALDLPDAVKANAGRFEAFGDVHVQPLDLQDPKDIDRAVQLIHAEIGTPDGLINNAATKGSDVGAFMKDALNLSLDTWREVSAVNLDGTFAITQSIGKLMVARGAGSILFIGSIYGEVAPDPRVYDGSQYLGTKIDTPPVYSATKAAVSGLARYLAAYWGQHGIRVNCLCPGGVASGQNDAFERRYSARVPLGRMATPTDIAEPVAFLMSDGARYISGQTLIVDGGLSAW
jgi:NAD(P)-dependent dehydrogenase (short-subunit alcohol dehydrogenase family)